MNVPPVLDLGKLPTPQHIILLLTSLVNKHVPPVLDLGSLLIHPPTPLQYIVLLLTSQVNNHVLGPRTIGQE